jgi:hypothetical protein
MRIAISSSSSSSSPQSPAPASLRYVYVSLFFFCLLLGVIGNAASVLCCVFAECLSVLPFLLAGGGRSSRILAPSPLCALYCFEIIMTLLSRILFLSLPSLSCDSQMFLLLFSLFVAGGRQPSDFRAAQRSAVTVQYTAPPVLVLASLLFCWEF